MDRERFLEFAVAGALINGAVYTLLVFAAAIHLQRPLPMMLAIITAGLAYLNCWAIGMEAARPAAVLNIAAILVGVAAGATLVWNPS